MLQMDARCAPPDCTAVTVGSASIVTQDTNQLLIRAAARSALLGRRGPMVCAARVAQAPRTMEQGQAACRARLANMDQTAFAPIVPQEHSRVLNGWRAKHARLDLRARMAPARSSVQRARSRTWRRPRVSLVGLATIVSTATRASLVRWLATTHLTRSAALHAQTDRSRGHRAWVVRSAVRAVQAPLVFALHVLLERCPPLIAAHATGATLAPTPTWERPCAKLVRLGMLTRTPTHPHRAKHVQPART